MKDQTTWDQHIDSVLFAYYTAAHDSTKMSPFFVMHLREANLGIKDDHSHEDLDEDDVEGKLEALVAVKGDIENQVEKNLCCIVNHVLLYFSWHRKLNMTLDITPRLA